jgi:hypothetical protein
MQNAQGLIAELDTERAKLQALVAGLDEAHAHKIVYGNWRVQDILAHIASGERASLSYVKMVAANRQMPAAPDAPPFDLDRWNQAQVEKRRSKALAEIIAELNDNRQATVAFVAGLDSDMLERRGSHPVFLHSTLAEVIQSIAEADRHHLQEIATALAN